MTLLCWQTCLEYHLGRLEIEIFQLNLLLWSKVIILKCSARDGGRVKAIGFHHSVLQESYCFYN